MARPESDAPGLKNNAEKSDMPQPAVRRSVRADLIEATPGASGQWVLASPFLAFLAWTWLDLFVHFSPIPWRWLDTILGAVVFLVVIILPLGLAAHWLITALPHIFQNAGWDVKALEPVREAEQYSVRYDYQGRVRAPRTWARTWLRAGQGWVYLEIVAILLGALALIPIFLSATDFGFGR